MTYEAFRGSGLDLSAVGFMPGGEAYFCTPVGGKILGRAGVDGIHFCAAPETGEMILAVSPANGAEDCIHPVARDFPDFLRLLLACGDTAALEQSWMWDEARFQAFLRAPPPRRERRPSPPSTPRASRPWRNPTGTFTPFRRGLTPACSATPGSTGSSGRRRRRSFPGGSASTADS